MTILTRSANILKGAVSGMTLNRTELAALVSDPYYQNTSNWKEVYFQFSHESGQKASTVFDQGNDNADFLVTHSARGGDWLINLITIKDFDNGHYQIARADIDPGLLPAMDFFMISGAAHGDLYIKAGETVQIAAGSDRVYGDLIIDAGGTLEILPGGAITTIDVTENCVINGTIKANSGEHTGGTWNKTALGESLVFTVAQQAGGAGGNGINLQDTVRSPETGEAFNDNAYTQNIPPEYDGTRFFYWINVDGTYYIKWNGVTVASTTGSSVSAGGYTYFRGAYIKNAISGYPLYAVYRTSIQNIPGALGGVAGFGNGGGGGKSHLLTPQDGLPGESLKGGNGGGGSIGAPVYGNNGADGEALVSAGAGGSRGAHGQALMLRAYKIQGAGTINAAGQKGGDGGSGTAGGSGHPAGGGGAGGSGGKIWLRYKTGTPNLNVLVTAGERGVAGWEDTHIVTNAQHGSAGQVGSVDSALY